MKTVRIIRVEQTLDGVFGALTIEGRAFCVTIEPPWRNNQRDISCIPDGEYICKQTMPDRSVKFGRTFEVMNVPDREDILFHWGNTIIDTEGCIIQGRYYGYVNSRNMRGVLASKATFTNFMNIMRREEEFKLVIKSV